MTADVVALSPGTDAPTATVLDVPFFDGAFDAAAELVISQAKRGAGGYACLTSVHGLMLAQHDPAVRAAIGGAWMNFPDGVPVTWVQRRRGATVADRVCGIDLMPRVVELGQAVGVRHYLVGSTEDVLTRLQGRLTTRYPEAQIVGRESPPFGSIEEHARVGVIDRIADAGPEIVWVGLGAPKQDLWCAAYAARLRPALVVAVGAAFDFVAGTKRRAPVWMRRSGLEWLYRLGSEPRRLAGRYSRANSEFVVRVAAAEARRAFAGRRVRTG
jgi:N-acetylglucosaminyldiphosphoundecaprenol N-acetyl-beta-D-mannosaminyltransferase